MTRIPCQRDNCTRSAPPDRGFCSPLCRFLVAEFDQCQRVCAALPDSSGVWANLVLVADALDAYRAAESALKIDANLTGSEWIALRRTP